MLAPSGVLAAPEGAFSLPMQKWTVSNCLFELDSGKQKPRGPCCFCCWENVHKDLQVEYVSCSCLGGEQMISLSGKPLLLFLQGHALESHQKSYGQTPTPAPKGCPQLISVPWTVSWMRPLSSP